MTSEGRGIQSIEVGGRILSALVAASSPMMLRDLAASADLAPAQCHAYLTSYRNIGLVEQDAQTGHYRLGSFAMRLGIARMRGVPILVQATKALAPLAGDLGQMALIVVWGPSGPTVVHVQEGASALHVNLRQGTLFSVTGTATGRVFAAFFADDAMDDLIARELDGRSATQALGVRTAREVFLSGVERVRQRGYAATAGAPIPGISAVSAPVFDERDAMAFAITLVGRIGELELEPDSAPVRRLLDTAAALSRTGQEVPA